LPASVAGRFAILGLGKLGGAELNYNSDLDLIFVYDAPEAAWWEARPCGAHEYFTKLAQTTITVLQVPTREGLVYRIDTRLRPSGRAGPLVSSLETFERYHRAELAVWERLALVKARPVGGDAELGCRLEELIGATVYGRGLGGDEVAEIHRIRMRIERELAREDAQQSNLKTGRGGLVDVEFLVQMLQLRHGRRLPSVRVRATLAGVQALWRAGVLSPDDARVLGDGYRFLRALEHRLRIERDQPVQALEREGEALRALARRMGYAASGDEASRLLADYDAHRDAIRGVYERWFHVRQN
jgi:glutamate-ammonia-ligase adenylyltransferase